MCRWSNNKIEEEPEFFDNAWFSYEAHFLLSGHVDSKNNGFWGIQTPGEVPQRPWHSVRRTAWVTMSKRDVIGLFWLEDADEEAVTVAEENNTFTSNSYD